ncbi:hypothetical protein JM47_00690 [Ureaplasma diversum]|uniref:Uncharacterized protein n=2 Tax=Ureaplasma diversum TaxID=42094 RepID=A0A084EV78_9BACT|nr:hypothetical protein [Ureaplasma diversum]AJQ45167.1 hypothetical protein JM47_00690 [Ureaplasma diversum]KEZ21870.1 hypothetical protein UDIV_7250 [Ureaplasma diversum NCTC 246]
MKGNNDKQNNNYETNYYELIVNDQTYLEAKAGNKYAFYLVYETNLHYFKRFFLKEVRDRFHSSEISFDEIKYDLFKNTFNILKTINGTNLQIQYRALMKNKIKHLLVEELRRFKTKKEQILYNSIPLEVAEEKGLIINDNQTPDLVFIRDKNDQLVIKIIELIKNKLPEWCYNIAYLLHKNKEVKEISQIIKIPTQRVYYGIRKIKRLIADSEQELETFEIF